MRWFNEWFRFSIVALALALLISPALALTTTTTSVGTDTLVIFNGTSGATTWTAPTGVTSVWYLVVGGGGGGGAQEGGGGGGGAFMNGTVAVSGGSSYNVVLGAGGTGAAIGTGLSGLNGGNSSFMNTTVGNGINAWGGGGGASGDGGTAGSGGSGGGGSYVVTTAGSALMGTAFGRNGGAGTTVANYGSGGGGGATAAGATGTTTKSGNGGNGNVTSINGSATYYGAGGGGGSYAPATPGTGGSSSTGGDGKMSAAGTNALTNTGSGGGGGGNDGVSFAGGSGSAGVVMLRYFVPVPVPAFSSNVTSGKAPLPVSFTDASVTTITAWNWSFTPVQGGNYSALQNPTYTFVNPGTYNVTLSVTNASGTNWTTKAITVNNPDTTVSSFTQNVTCGNAPVPVSFTDTSTGHGISSWSWNYTLSGVSTVFSTSQNPTYTFNDAGTYQIRLLTTNSGGSNLSQPSTLIVNGFDAPIANFTVSPSSGTPGALISFLDNSTVTNTTGLVYNWSFGTGGIDLTPFSAAVGSTSHVYNYGGVYNINLTVSNYNGSSFKYVPAGVIISTEQRMTNWYSPHQVRFRVLDGNDNPIKAAYINATAYESSLPGGFAGAQQVLIEMYGINSISASQMVSSAVQMQGYTADDGAASFTMHGNLKYLVYVVDTSGNTYTKTFYPQMDQYLIRVTSSGYTVPQDTTNVLLTQGNATLTFSEPNTSYCTMGLDYMDITGRTTNVAFTAKLLNNQTVMYTANQAIVGAQHVLLNYTVPNNRGQQWKWYYNATVV